MTSTKGPCKCAARAGSRVITRTGNPRAVSDPTILVPSLPVPPATRIGLSVIWFTPCCDPAYCRIRTTTRFHEFDIEPRPLDPTLWYALYRYAALKERTAIQSRSFPFPLRPHGIAVNGPVD